MASIVPITGPACFGVMATAGAWVVWALEEAATGHGPKGACFKITASPVSLYFSTNKGPYYKD